MCHEMWMWWLRARDREEDESVWDLFERETRTEAPRYVSDDDRDPAERTTPEHATASTRR
jgi:hypothetical protein